MVQFYLGIKCVQTLMSVPWRRIGVIRTARTQLEITHAAAEPDTLSLEDSSA